MLHAAARTSLLDARLAELVMSALCPCDLGDGLEVLHDVEALEIEMECDVDDDDAPRDPDAGDTLRCAFDPGDELASDTLRFAFDPEDEPASDTIRFALDPEDELASTTEFSTVRAEDVGTHQFVRSSAPYERIELVLDPQAYIRATIEDAKRLARSPSA